MKTSRSSTFLLTAFLLTVLPTVLSAQQTAEQWQGTFNAGSEPQRIAVETTRSSKGAMQAQKIYIEYFHDDAKIDSFSAKGKTVRFSIEGGKGVFAGKLGGHGTTMAGTWTYDKRSMPLVLTLATQANAWRTPFLYQYHMKDVTYLRPSPNEKIIPFSAPRALDYLEKGAVAWTADWGCVACHTNGTYMVVRPLMTRQLGAPYGGMRLYFISALRAELAQDPARPDPEIEPKQAVYIAAGLAMWDAEVIHELTDETKQAMEYMFKVQSPDGAWVVLPDDTNPPFESSRFQLATIAARAVGNAPDWARRQIGTPVEHKINLMKDFLRGDQKMQGDYDRTHLLWASAELPGLIDDGRKREIVDMIFAHQKSDGGWSIRSFARPEEWGSGNRAQKLRSEAEFVDPPSDGHMTGLAIIALRKAGVPADDPRIMRGVQWLLANQRESGRWYTRSLNRDGWQFITYSGTAYPMLALALCDALPAGREANGPAVNRNPAHGAGR